MKIIETKLNGVCIIEPDVFADERGSFTKTFHAETFAKTNFNTSFQESFYSVSNKGVIRGMHFQVPPQDHAKLVYVPYGDITDVVLDIRKGSPTYGEYVVIENLTGDNHKMVYIPRGFAHGFVSNQDGSVMVYLQETMRSAECEAGIRYDSFGMNWGVENPILSKRDKEFPELKDYTSPFVFKK